MLQFTKMQAAGNDFVVVDATKTPLRLRKEEICFLSDRHYGIGFDQLLEVKKSKRVSADFDYRIFNADGSEAEMCGNGARCFALYVLNHGLTDKKKIVVKAKNGFITLEVLEKNVVRVMMGKALFAPEMIPFISQDFVSKTKKKATLYKVGKKDKKLWFGVANMGNPHAIFPVASVWDAPLEKFAKIIEKTRAFPEGVNVSALEVQTKQTALLRVFERGVGETLACGSGACAAFSLAHQMGLLKEKAIIRMRGGQVTVEIDQDDNIFLTGSASEVFTGCIARYRKEDGHD